MRRLRHLKWIVYVPVTLVSMICGAALIWVGALLAYAIVVGVPLWLWEWAQR